MELYELTAHELGYLIKNKKVSVVELTKIFLDRIEEVDLTIGSYITVCRDKAIKCSKEVQKRIEKKGAISPLAGIPMALKDNICTEGILTTCASKMLYNFIPPYSATIAKKLFDNDTILLGKLNMDEFAMGNSTENSYFKKTKNPWDTKRAPGGSSGGAAAAVTAGEAVFSIGTDTGGSIRQPASFCGLVGMKPTYGAVSRYGVVALASSLDQAGPLTKDVTDCALVLNAITGHDKMDSTSAGITHPDYSKALVNDVKGLKIGILKEYIDSNTSDEVKKSILGAVDIFKKLGAKCEEFSMPITGYVSPAYYTICSAEASSNLARYDGIKYGYRAENYSNLLELYKNTRGEGFSAEAKRRIMFGTYALSSKCYDIYYKKALKVRTLVKKAFDEALEKYDIIMGPASKTTAFKLGEKVSCPVEECRASACMAAVNIAGLPGIVIPCGTDSQNMPVGLQLIGRAFDESTLLRSAYTFEQNTEFHKARPQI